MNAVLPLTKTQRAVLEFLTEFIRSNGFGPSLEEIGKHCGTTSLATAHKHLENLAAKGYIRRAWNRSRSIELLWQSGACPTCGQPMPSSERAELAH